mgnify:CR=1 FL=1
MSRALASGDQAEFSTMVVRALRLLLRETSVLRKGCVNLELVPGSLFGFYRVMPMGAGLWEQMASVRLLRDVLEECGPSGDVTPAGSGLGGQTA